PLYRHGRKNDRALLFCDVNRRQKSVGAAWPRCQPDRLFGRFRLFFFLRDFGGVFWRRADPGVLRAIEHDAVGSAEFRLEEDAAPARIGPHEAGRAHRFELFDMAVEIVNQHAEMMDTDIVETLADLIDILEFEHGEVERAVAEIDAPGNAARII